MFDCLRVIVEQLLSDNPELSQNVAKVSAVVQCLDHLEYSFHSRILSKICIKIIEWQNQIKVSVQSIVIYRNIR